jgi:tetratricopeptide (TPR) repeat protein
MNIAGKNLVFPRVYDQYPAAVVVGSLENIIVASKNGFIYEYNSEGSLLFVFGARDDGKQRIGLFKTVSAIDVDSSNRLYVLDEEKNEIQIFGTTEFADLVHKAVDLYQKGRYTESKAPWKEVLKMNSLFDYANLGIGEAYYKEEEYDQALTVYRLAKNYHGYSQAFWEVRNIWMKENLAFIILGLLLFYCIMWILKRVDRKIHIYNPIRSCKKKVFSLRLIKEMSFITYLMKDPADGYYGIRREEKVSSLAAHSWLAIAFVIYIANKYGSSYLYRPSMEGRFDLLNDVYFFFGIIFMLVISHYLVTSINDGEGRFKDIYQGFVYALGPYILVKPWLILLSHGLTYNESFIIQFGNLFINTWTLIMVVLMIKYINDYSAKETFKVILYTLFTMLIGILVLFIVYVLLSQVIVFVQSIIGEVVYKFVS